jgi:hypothetical protein
MKLKMAVLAAGLVFGATILMAAAAAPPATAPAPGPEPAAATGADKWEYCEIHYSSQLRVARGAAGAWNAGGRGARGGGRGGPGGAGGAGGPGGAAAVVVQRVTIRWITGDDEVGATSWEDLGTKLKAPAAKKGASEAVRKLKVLNFLGKQGWELVSQQEAASSVWTFKRKVKK